MKPESSEDNAHDSRLTAAPERTCIVTREAKPKEALLRFVVGPNDQVVFDVAGKLPGRGIYVTCSKLSVAEAIAKRAFSRAAKQQVSLAPDFMDRVHALMEERVGDGLSFARKGGLVICGFEKVEDALKSGEVAALLHASDAGEDGKKKLGGLVRALAAPHRSSPPAGERDLHLQVRGGSAKEGYPPTDALKGRIDSPAGGEWASGASVPTYDQLSRELLGKVVGRDNAVHVAVLKGDASAFFMEAMRRFALFLE